MRVAVQCISLAETAEVGNLTILLDAIVAVAVWPRPSNPCYSSI